MRILVLTPKFKRAFRKFARRDPRLRKHIEQTLGQMQADLFQASLGTHKLSGDLQGLYACVAATIAESYFQSSIKGTAKR